MRDDIIGRKSKDIDYAVEAPSFEDIVKHLEIHGKVHLSKPECYTVRGRLPELGDVDFVWCRKDGPYTDGRRPDYVERGSLYDDLARRDFTMNAIAVDKEGNVYDPHDGQADIKAKLITCVGKVEDRLREDSLRMLRAIRFHIQLGFIISPQIEKCLDSDDFLKLLSNVSLDRTVTELEKMFRYDSLKTMRTLVEVYPGVGSTIFAEKRLWLLPTLRQA